MITKVLLVIHKVTKYVLEQNKLVVLSKILLQWSQAKVKPGLNAAATGVELVDLGSTTEKFNAVYATNLYGTSEKASALIVGGNARTGAVDSTGTGTGNSVAVRDSSSGNLNAVSISKVQQQVQDMLI